MITPQTGPKLNYQTGEALTDRQVFHLEQIADTVDLLYSVMHAAEGSADPGEHQEHQFMSRRMSVAATHLEICMMMARKAALESP